MAAAAREYELVVYGATGFTGRLVARHVAGLDAMRGRRWALAGRDAARVEAVREAECGEGSAAPAAAAAVVASTGDEASLAAMARRARLVINCVGPFRFHGLPVVAACAAAGTHYVDISGEPSFIERAMLLHDAEARRTGALLVPACGFDSVPCDAGVLHAADAYRRLHGEEAAGDGPALVRGYLRVRGGDAGVAGHYATYESAVHGVANAGELRAVRRELRERQTDGGRVQIARPAAAGPAAVPRAPSRPHYSDEAGAWVARFPGADASVVRSTQHLRAARRPGVPQPRHEQYFCTPGLGAMLGTAAFGGALAALAPWSWTRSLLLAWPRVFSLGVFSHEGPTDEQLRGTSFEMLFVATGTCAATGKPLRSATRVRGPEPGYVATPRIVAACALAVLDDPGSLDTASGVVTPGAAFGCHPALLDRLAAGGVHFEACDAQ